MRILLTLILIAAALWSGYWYVGSGRVEWAVANWFAARRAEGWQADYRSLKVQGFPNRFDIVFDAPALADPETGLAWSAPRLQVNALSYRPNHVIAVWPETQTIATPQQTYSLQSRDMRASLVVSLRDRLALQRSVLQADRLRILPRGADPEQRMTMEHLSLAADRLSEDEARGDASGVPYRLGLRADGLRPPMAWRTQLGVQDRLPDRFDALQADMTVRFDRPWDLRAIEQARPQPTHVRITRAEARWGRLELAVAGTFDVEDGGHPAGEITVKAKNWREILDLAVTSGAVPEQFAGTLQGALSMMARGAGNPETLDIPLRLRGGRVWLGLVPLGRAPVLRLR